MRRTPLRRTAMRPKRATPRRREAPRWDPEGWEDANALLVLRAGARCECCGKPFAGAPDDTPERHHRMRRRDGGDRLSNLLMLRRACHAYWTEHPAEAIGRGIIVPTYRDPATSPVLWRGTEWSVLTDDGERLPADLG